MTPITDEQVEAAIRVMVDGVPVGLLEAKAYVGEHEWELTRRALEAAEAAAWRPISEAPKDKWLLLGWRNNDGTWRQTTGCWCDDFDATGFDDDTMESIYRGAWTDYGVGSFSHEEYSELHPTHFRPLPLPPRGGD